MKDTENRGKFDFSSALGRLESAFDWSRTDEDLALTFRERARLLATPPDEGDDAVGIRHLVFALEGVRLAVALSSVESITAATRVGTIPRVPEHLSRVVQIGGRVVSLVDLRPLLGMSPGDGSKDPNRIVFVRAGRSLMGLMASELEGIVLIDTDDLSQATSHMSDAAGLLSGIAADMTLVLDVLRMTSELRFGDQAKA